MTEKGDGAARASLELLYHISREFASALDLRTVLQRVVLLSMQTVGAKSGSLIVLDDTGSPEDSIIITGGKVLDGTTQRLRVTLEKGLAGWVAEHRQAVLILDTTKDIRWLPSRYVDAGDLTPRSAVSAPVLTRDRLVGVITLSHDKPGIFSEDHLNLVQAIADQAGTAVEHAQLFERLQAAHQRYRELFEDSIEPIVLTDWKGAVVEANRQAIQKFGYDRKSLLSLNIGELHLVDPSKTGPAFELLASGETVTYESTLHLHSGLKLPVEVYVRQVNTGAGGYLQWILHDISERISLENLRKDLIAMVYHDLQSPLANVVSSLDMAGAVLPPGDESLPALIGIASRSTRRIQRLIDSLLDLNKLEAGQPVGLREAVSPKSLLYDAVDVVEQSIQGKRQEIEILAEQGIPPIFADPDMIRRVLINLLENANKYTPPFTRIEAGALGCEGEVCMWVADNGPGIPEAEQQHIFQKFSRLNGATKGLGLGLAFCKLAVEAHGGRIWVESNPGVGSKFIFCIPTAVREEPGS